MMKKIIYFTLYLILSCFVLAFVFGCKNENQSQKKQEQLKLIEKKETPKKEEILKKEEKTTGINYDELKLELHLAAESSNNPEEILALIEKGVNINDMISQPDYCTNVFYFGFNISMTALQLAVSCNNNSEIITTLIQAGADVNARDSKGNTPLCNIAVCTRVQIISMLIVSA